ncbi:hypothetical protein MAQ5080_02627 [Marinomonas aquimarina]|uniref:DUF1840 domain-containing protein n=1 Tax=Marinomonas aquimarina TaxID=295068 RepID=A0A1A8TIT4_9GAMM|nr:DUF1840 domain-containing protein [Marinomonas aquimarina]SBS33615.1 hypothetical protein MAQ5080_02627 [Marinomonas aquimarina]
MLMTFRCNAYANIMMFGSVGLQLVKMMGYGESSSGAIKAEDIPQALARLQTGLSNTPEDIEQPDLEQDEDEEDEEQQEVVVSLAKRALPLIEMLNAATRDECGIMWESK